MNQGNIGGLVPVQSSNIRAIGYCGGTLTVAFQNGTYEYTGVPQEAYRAFMEAPSKGKHFWAQVRGRYTYTKREVQE